MKHSIGLRLLILSAVLFSSFRSAQAQDSLAGTYIDIGKIPLAKSIGRYCNSTYTDLRKNWAANFSSIQFTKGIIHKGTVPNGFVTKKALLEFNICNSADSTVSIYFFPGFYYKDIHLFRVRANGLIELPKVLPTNGDSIGYRLVSLPPGDSATLIAELTFLKTYINALRPRLINTDYLDSFITDLHNTHNDGDLITYVFCGLLLMMILYSIANYFQGANPEFLYYSGYAFFLGMMLFTKAVLNYHTTRLNFFAESYLDFILQGLGIMFYMIFMQRFLATKSRYRFLHSLYNGGVILILLSILSYSYFHYFTDNFHAENNIENATKLLLLVLVLVFLLHSLRYWEDRLLRYLFWGNLFYAIFAIMSVVLILDQYFLNLKGIFRNSLIYYEVGLLIELVFFLAGLNHKNRRKLIEQTREHEKLKAENQMKEYEKELAVYKAQQQERERISADMHDELGSGMTAIRLMSEIARNKMKENTPVEIEKISHSANDVLNKMNAIIWSMNIGNDSLDNLVSYIRSYALEYFDNTPIHCKVNTPDQIADKELTGDKRRNIFLCVKETLNNALKHSKASLITIDIESNHHLLIRISDNGVGIDMQNLRQFGNGLKNIGRRMESIGGTFTIENKGGTVTVLDLPL